MHNIMSLVREIMRESASEGEGTANNGQGSNRRSVIPGHYCPIEVVFTHSSHCNKNKLRITFALEFLPRTGTDKKIKSLVFLCLGKPHSHTTTLKNKQSTTRTFYIKIFVTFHDTFHVFFTTEVHL